MKIAQLYDLYTDELVGNLYQKGCQHFVVVIGDDTVSAQTQDEVMALAQKLNECYIWPIEYL